MPVTRAYLEKTIVDRCGPQMAKCLMTVTFAGSNASLDDPLGRACRDAGLTLADSTTVTDADLAAVGVDQLDEVLDRAELRTLESCSRRYKSVTVNVSGVMAYNSDFGRQLAQEVSQCEKTVIQTWGVARGAPVAIRLRLGFTATDPSGGW